MSTAVIGICGSQKHPTNHWFVACERPGELHISGWNSLHLLSPGTRRLCGEICAHSGLKKEIPAKSPS